MNKYIKLAPPYVLYIYKTMKKNYIYLLISFILFLFLIIILKCSNIWISTSLRNKYPIMFKFDIFFSSVNPIQNIFFRTSIKLLRIQRKKQIQFVLPQLIRGNPCSPDRIVKRTITTNTKNSIWINLKYNYSQIHKQTL